MLNLSTTVLCILIWTVSSDFRCPKLEHMTPCRCKNETWWNNKVLSIVNCSDSDLQEVPDFSYLQSLKITKLLLNKNNISVLSDRSFNRVSVEEIDLSRNSIKTFENQTLSHLSGHLKKLVLKWDEIPLDRGLYFLHGLKELEELSLDSNFIENDKQYLPGNLFANLGLASLKKLSLQSCDIKNISADAFIGLETLEELDLRYNDLEEIPKAIFSLLNLKVLVLYGNNIIRLRNNTFIKLNKLEKLDLSANGISTIESGAFVGLEHSLKELLLHYTDLSTVPTSALQRLEHLTSLVLSRNRIHFVPESAFKGLVNLEMLELDNNPLVYYKEMFSGLENTLETLTIRGTGLTSLPKKSLMSLKKLSYLDVSFNNIGDLHDNALDGLNIKTIVLTNSNITKISPRAFTGLKNPVGLDLDHNSISNISFILEAEPCIFKYIDLTGNPVLCDCDTEKILNSGVIHYSLTGSCTMHTGSAYKLGSSLLISELTMLCNETTRMFWCHEAVQSHAVSKSELSSLTIFFIFIIFVISV